MNIRFQKRVKLLPFLWLNLSKKSMSVILSLGFIKINVGKRGVWLSGSIKGTGLSARKQIIKRKKKQAASN